jgi:uncharacterized protein
MIERFFDGVSGGFFDTSSANTSDAKLGVLGARRKPFQDSPTPAGNPVAAIALLRLYEYTNQADYRQKAEQTLEIFAGAAAQYGLFAATYGIVVTRLSQSHVQVVVIGSDSLAEELYRTALAPFCATKSVLMLGRHAAVAQNLPPALAETLPKTPAVREGKTAAVICSGFTCQPPISDAEELGKSLRAILAKKPEQEIPRAK